MKLKINSGDRFGKLTAISEGQSLRLPSGQINRTIRCKCDCGKSKDIRLLHLVRGRIQSCGCVQKTQKGLSGEKLFKVWKGMIERCLGKVPKSPQYLRKNIKVCEEWADFENFFRWAKSNGYKEGLQVDRQDNTKGYSPENCRFVTAEVNCNNRDNTFFVIYDGKKTPLSILLREKQLSNHYATIMGRIKRGYSGQEAVDKPIKKGNYRKLQMGS